MFGNSDLPKATQISLANFVLNEFKKVHFLNPHIADTNVFLFNDFSKLLIITKECLSIYRLTRKFLTH